MTKQADLIEYLFNGHKSLLSKSMLQWMDASPRFTSFVDTYRDKIRKKVRTTGGGESAVDLLSELEAAYCLLNDRRLELVYEPYASEKRRGADFAVTYRANLVFNVEVTRLRSDETAAEDAPHPRTEERLLRILFSKLGQMQAGMPNLLLIHTSPAAQSTDLNGLMQWLKTLAEGKDSAFYTTTGYTSPADFFRDFLRLTGIVLWSSQPQLWVNRQAKPALDEKVLRLVVSLLSGAPES